MIAEGIETALSAMQATAQTAWAALSTSGLRTLELPADVRDVVVLADGASWWELPVDGTREDLRKALRVPIDTYRKHRTILGTIAETAAYDPRAQEQQQNLIDQVVSALTTYIGDAQRAGVADAHLDAARTAQWLIWMIERGLYQLVGTADDDEVPKVTRWIRLVTDRDCAGHSAHHRNRTSSPQKPGPIDNNTP